MSRSDDPGHYFQTSDALATTDRKAAKAKNKHGKPIKLQSKILAVVPSPGNPNAANDRTVYVAEAAGNLKRVTLETGESYALRPPATISAPLTSIACSTALYCGCWDKKIYGFRTAGPMQQTTGYHAQLSGHTDFVKCLIGASTNDNCPLLISGGADATIIVWDVRTGGKLLHKLKGSTKAIQDLAVDPHGVPDDLDEPLGGLVLYSASSDREIRRWFVSRDKAYELPESVAKPILAHDTSIYKLRFDSDGDLWTASADKTAKHLVRRREWEADTVLQHPDFVRDVVMNDERGLVVTACRDEEVRVWSAGSGDLVCTYCGHYEEVTGLALVGDAKVVSVSIDGTVRQWSLHQHDMKDYLDKLARENEDGPAKDEAVEKGGGVLTAEEEAELAELMDDDDD